MSVCTNGASAMIGARQGFAVPIKQVSQYYKGKNLVLPIALNYNLIEIKYIVS